MYTSSAAPAPEVQPEVTLHSWQVFELESGTRHFCGFRMENDIRRGRVSSDIIRFEPSTMTGVTESGRVYRLEGPAGEGDEITVLRDTWLAHHGLSPEAATECDVGERIADRLM